MRVSERKKARRVHRFLYWTTFWNNYSQHIIRIDSEIGNFFFAVVHSCRTFVNPLSSVFTHRHLNADKLIRIQSCVIRNLFVYITLSLWKFNWIKKRNHTKHDWMKSMHFRYLTDWFWWNARLPISIANNRVSKRKVM